MASKVIYLVVKLEINDSSTKEITEEDVDKVISNVDYEFKDLGGFKLKTEIYGQISPDQL